MTKKKRLGPRRAARGIRMPGPRCSVAATLSKLGDQDRAAVEAAFAGEVSSTDLSSVLRAYGYRVMPQTLRRHIRDLCSCSAGANNQLAEYTSAGSIEGALHLLTSKGGRA